MNKKVGEKMNNIRTNKMLKQVDMSEKRDLVVPVICGLNLYTLFKY